MSSYSLLHETPLPAVWEGLELFLKSSSPLAIACIGMILLFTAGATLRLLLQRLRLREMRSADAEFLDAYGLSEQPASLYLAGKNHPRSPCWKTYESASRELCQHLTGASTVNTELVTRFRTAGRISPSQMTAIRHVIHHQARLSMQSLRPQSGQFITSTLPVMGLISTLTLWMHDSYHQLHFSLYPSLLPLIISLVLALLLQFWRCIQHHSINKAQERVENLISIWTRDVERLFVDHRKPLKLLPSLTHMSKGTEPSPQPIPTTPNDHT